MLVTGVADQKGFDDAMKEQKERARAKWAGSGEKSVEQIMCY
jgi:hypothetical protein